MSTSPPRTDSKVSSETVHGDSNPSSGKNSPSITGDLPQRMLPSKRRHELTLANLVHGTEAMDAPHTRPSIERIHNNMTSCPEFHGPHRASSEVTPSSTGSRNSLNQRRPPSRSPVPSTLRSRLAERFRLSRPWKSSVGPNYSSLPNSPPIDQGESKMLDGKERRRRARASEQNCRTSSEEGTPRSSSGIEEEGPRGLAMATALLAVSDLDRLSIMARKEEETRGKEVS